MYVDARSYGKDCDSTVFRRSRLWTSVQTNMLVLPSERPFKEILLNHLTPNDLYTGRTAPLTSKRFILYIYSTSVGTEYFKHALYSPFFLFKMQFFFIMLTCLVPVLFTHNANLFGFCIIHILYTECAKIKKNNSGAKGLIDATTRCEFCSAQQFSSISLYPVNFSSSS